MEILIGFGIYIALCAGVGYVARTRGRSGFAYTVISLITTPVLAYLILLIAAGGEAGLVPCPRCAEKIQRKAQVCRFCGVQFVPPPAQAAPRGMIT